MEVDAEAEVLGHSANVAGSEQNSAEGEDAHVEVTEMEMEERERIALDAKQGGKRQSRKRKQSDVVQNLPDEMYQIFPESRFYSQLLALEHRIDSSIARKKIEFREAVIGQETVSKMIKVIVTHKIVENSGGNERFLIISISGVITDPCDRKSKVSATTEGNALTFNSILKKITVILEDSLVGSENSTIEWVRNDSGAVFDGFEIRRSILPSCTLEKTDVKVLLVLDQFPSRFRMCSALKKIEPFLENINRKADTKSSILRSLWQYIKNRKLLDPQDPNFVVCDENLQDAFGSSRIMLSDINSKLRDLLIPADSFDLIHQADMAKIDDEDTSSNASMWDLSVEIPKPVNDEFVGWFEHASPVSNAISDCELRIKQVIYRIHAHKKRMELLKGFSQSPVDIIRLLIANQARDLSLMSEKEALQEAQKRSDFFKQDADWVPAAVDHYLSQVEKRKIS